MKTASLMLSQCSSITDQTIDCPVTFKIRHLVSLTRSATISIIIPAAGMRSFDIRAATQSTIHGYASHPRAIRRCVGVSPGHLKISADFKYAAIADMFGSNRSAVLMFAELFRWSKYGVVGNQFNPMAGANRSSLSTVNMNIAKVICFVLLMHLMPCALIFALESAGNNIAARIAMIAITTSNSIKVNPRGFKPPLGL